MNPVHTLLSDFSTSQIQIIFPSPPIYYARTLFTDLRSKSFIRRFSLLYVPTVSSYHIILVFITQNYLPKVESHHYVTFSSHLPPNS